MKLQRITSSEGSCWIITSAEPLLQCQTRSFGCVGGRVCACVCWGGGMKSSCKRVKGSFKVKLCEGWLFGEGGLISCPIMWFATSPPLLPLFFFVRAWWALRAVGLPYSPPAFISVYRMLNAIMGCGACVLVCVPNRNSEVSSWFTLDKMSVSLPHLSVRKAGRCLNT